MESSGSILEAILISGKEGSNPEESNEEGEENSDNDDSTTTDLNMEVSECHDENASIDQNLHVSEENLKDESNSEKLKSIKEKNVDSSKIENIMEKWRAEEDHSKKPFSCKVCDYKSEYKSNMIVHARTHTGRVGTLKPEF